MHELTLELLGGANCPLDRQAVVRDEYLGLTDFTVLKTLRANKYAADKAFADISAYVKSHCLRLIYKRHARMKLVH